MAGTEYGCKWGYFIYNKLRWFLEFTVCSSVAPCVSWFGRRRVILAEATKLTYISIIHPLPSLNRLFGMECANRLAYAKTYIGLTCVDVTPNNKGRRTDFIFSIREARTMTTHSSRVNS